MSINDNFENSEFVPKFKGGIQKGTTVLDEESKKLDSQLKKVSQDLYKIFSSKGLSFQKKLKKEQIPGGIGACQPDGGLWFNSEGKLIAVFEAKKQNNHGNAIERWFKNNFICRLLNPDVCYITFCAGSGAKEGGIIQLTLNVAHQKGSNSFIKKWNSVFYSIDGFTDDEIFRIMKNVLEYCTKEMND